MKLIICNTYSQLIIAIQLSITLFKEDKVDLWISDHSNNVEKIINPLKDSNIFREVKFIQDKKFVYGRNKIESIIDAMEYSFGKIKKWDIECYDEIIFYSLSLMLYSIADYYMRINHNVKWSRMEEGIFSYETDFESGLRIKLTRKLRNISRRCEIAKKIENYYCFFPELKHTQNQKRIIRIPSIKETKVQIVNVLCQIFGCSTDIHQQKYIFFASSSDIDGRPFGETEIILKVAQLVGEKNLVVKTHPRDNRSVYEDCGIAVMKSSWIPWEVLQLVGNYENKVMLTVNSGAFITVSALENSKGVGGFLYPAVMNKSVAFIKREKEIDDMLIKLHSMRLCEKINAYSFESLKEFYEKEEK